MPKTSKTLKTNGVVRTVAARRAKVISLVESGVISSQSDLVKELKKFGYKVTQATASRDLEEIGAVRASDGYRLGSNNDDSLSKVLGANRTKRNNSLILSVESSGNLVVVRTPPGGAHLLASNLDHASIKSIIGTIAGDDTVLVVSRKANGGADLAKELQALSSELSSLKAKRKSRGGR
jgi:transcriptional regulator of arginine metabolism